jgi:hypothetical protein
MSVASSDTIQIKDIRDDKVLHVTEQGWPQHGSCTMLVHLALDAFIWAVSSVATGSLTC